MMWYLLFCFVNPSIAIDYEIYKTFSPEADTQNLIAYYPFFPIRDNRINFKVKAGSHAQVVLTTGPHLSEPMFEILIGTYNNRYMYMRKNNNPNQESYEYTGNIINKMEYHGFWIQLDYEKEIKTHDWFGYKSYKSSLKISIGKENDVEPLMTSDEVNPYNYNFFGIGSRGEEAHWEIQDIIYPLYPPRYRIINLTENESYPTYKKFVNVAERLIRFEVKAGIEVRIALAPTDKAEKNFFEITFRKDGKVIFYNHVTRDSKYYTATNLLSSSKFHRFWVRLARNDKNQFNTSTIELGRDDDEPFIINDDTEPLIVNYFSYTTIGSTGTWILEETRKPPILEGRTYIETINNKKIIHEQFFKISGNFLRLQFRGRQASIVLTAEAYELHPVYQFIISPNGGRHVLFKSNDMNITSGILPWHFNEDEYQDFWIKFNRIDSKLGNRVEISFVYGNDVTPIIETIVNENVFDVKYFSLATFGDSGSGYWILEDSSIPEEDVVVVKRLITAPTPMAKMFLDNPVYSNVVTFRVKATEDVSVYLLSNSNVSNKIEIQIGHERNTVNGIVKNNKRQLIARQTLLDETEYRGFWIKFSNVTNNTGQLIRVGHEDFVDPFMAWVDSDYYAIKEFGVTTHSRRGYWIIKTKQKKPNHIFIDDDLYTPGNGVISYFGATTQCMKFKVHAKSDAVIVLSSTKDIFPPFIRITLSKDGGSDNTIDKNGVKKFCKENSLLHKTDFREFWVQWDYLSDGKMLINFGRAGETKPIIHWLDDEAFLIHYVGFTTNNAINGTWSIPNFKCQLY